jgi:hypothetical protein
MLIILIIFSSLSYSKNNEGLLFSIFKGFAKGVLTEVAENVGSKTAKFFLEDGTKTKEKITTTTITIEDTLLSTLNNWNTANNKRDTTTLYKLYGYSVLYYGFKRTDNECIADKNKFYKKHPFFSQTIENIIYKEISKNLYKVSFDKYVQLKESKKITNYPSYLVIDTSFNTPLVMVEGDKVTDKNLLKRYGK